MIRFQRSRTASLKPFYRKVAEWTVVKIFTNSVSDLTPQDAQKLGVTIIPDTIAFSSGEQYYNNVDIDPPTLYRRLEECKKLPTTAHPNLDQYMRAFQSAGDHDEILCITLTSKMSGSFNTAGSACKLLREQGFDTPITVYDSQQVSFGLALLVVRAARMAMRGCTVAEILPQLDELRPKVGVYFVMESLQNARKGGRVGAIRVLAADMLKVKPILTFRDGLVKDLAIVRGYDNALEQVIQKYRQRAKYGGEVFLFHADRRELAERVRLRLLDIDPQASIGIYWVGAVIGIYTGAGCLGIAFEEQ